MRNPCTQHIQYNYIWFHLEIFWVILVKEHLYFNYTLCVRLYLNNIQMRIYLNFIFRTRCESCINLLSIYCYIHFAVYMLTHFVAEGNLLNRFMGCHFFNISTRSHVSLYVHRYLKGLVVRCATSYFYSKLNICHTRLTIKTL